MEQTHKDLLLQEVMHLSHQGLKNRLHQIIYAGALTLLGMVWVFHDLLLGLGAAAMVAALTTAVIYNIEYSHHHFQMHQMR